MLAAFAAGIGLAFACDGGPGTPDFPVIGDREPPGRGGFEVPPDPREAPGPTTKADGSALGLAGTAGTSTVERPSDDTDGVAGSGGTSGASGSAGVDASADTGSACLPCPASYECTVRVDSGASVVVPDRLSLVDGTCRTSNGLSLACDGTVRSEANGDVGTWSRSGTGFAYCASLSSPYCADCALR